MKSGPLISIIVPAYNAAPYLPALCDSILAQTYENFEALFYDDGSTDHTLDVLKSYERDSRFRVFRGERNKGVNVATNELFKVFRGEFWCHPGADDLILPQFLERRAQSLEENPNAALVHGPAAETIDELSRKVQVAGPVQPNPPARMQGVVALSVLLQHNLIATSSIIARSSVTRKVLPCFQTNWKYAQDWYLWLLHAATSGEILWDSTPMHVYRIHSSSLTNVPAKAAVRRAELRLVPLAALSCGASYSPDAAQLWKKWKDALYNLWLVRAYSLKKDKVLDPEWMQISRKAFYAREYETGVEWELIRRAPSVIATLLRERKLRSQQLFPVSGLAQMDHSFFRDAKTSR
jgi:glycosyltransferase involved in cell wall biosynthesis